LNRAFLGRFRRFIAALGELCGEFFNNEKTSRISGDKIEAVQWHSDCALINWERTLRNAF
jgi:hypothetical protein